MVRGTTFDCAQCVSPIQFHRLTFFVHPLLSFVKERSSEQQKWLQDFPQVVYSWHQCKFEEDGREYVGDWKGVEKRRGGIVKKLVFLFLNSIACLLSSNILIVRYNNISTKLSITDALFFWHSLSLTTHTLFSYHTKNILIALNLSTKTTSSAYTP